MKNKLPLVFSISIILVNFPVFILAYLSADNITLSVTPIFLSIRAVGTVLVLTGGAVYLSHEMAKKRALAPLVLLALVLIGMPFLIVPMLLANMRGETLVVVLQSLSWRDFLSAEGIWATLSVVLPEMVAYGIFAMFGTSEHAESGFSILSALQKVAISKIEQYATNAELPDKKPVKLATIRCASCSREFKSKKALNAHKRFCKHERTVAQASSTTA